MSRYLFSFIGNHDPGDGSPDENGVINDGPLPSIFRHLQSMDVTPEKVILFYTPPDPREHSAMPQDNTAAEHNETCQRLEHLCPGINIESVLLADANNIPVNPAREEEVLPIVLQWLNQNPISSTDECHVNLASGTGAMRSIWSFLVDARILSKASVWNSLNPFKHKDPMTRIELIGMSYLDEARYIVTATSLMKSMAFAEAGSILTSISEERVTTQRVRRARFWRSLLAIYAFWDRAFYEEADRQFKMLRNDPIYTSLPQTIAKILDDQSAVLTQVAASRSQPKSLPVLFDLYASLSRRVASGQYANVAARTRRILEGSVRYVICQNFNNAEKPDAVHDAHVFSEFEGGLNTVITKAENHLSRFGSIVLLNRTDTWGVTLDTFAFTFDRLNDIKQIYYNIADQLNKSIEIHGFKSPNQDRVPTLIMATRRCLSFICYKKIGTSIPSSETLVFGSEIVKTLADLMQDWV